MRQCGRAAVWPRFAATRVEQPKPKLGIHCNGGPAAHSAALRGDGPESASARRRIDGSSDDSSGVRLVGRYPAVLHPNISHRLAFPPLPINSTPIMSPMQSSADRRLRRARLRGLDSLAKERHELVHGQAIAAVRGRPRRGSRLRRGIRGGRRARRRSAAIPSIGGEGCGSAAAGGAGRASAAGAGALPAAIAAGAAPPPGLAR